MGIGVNIDQEEFERCLPIQFSMSIAVTLATDRFLEKRKLKQMFVGTVQRKITAFLTETFQEPGTEFSRGQ